MDVMWWNSQLILHIIKIQKNKNRNSKTVPHPLTQRDSDSDASRIEFDFDPIPGSSPLTCFLWPEGVTIYLFSPPRLIILVSGRVRVVSSGAFGVWTWNSWCGWVHTSSWARSLSLIDCNMQLQAKEQSELNLFNWVLLVRLSGGAYVVESRSDRHTERERLWIDTTQWRVKGRTGCMCYHRV